MALVCCDWDGSVELVSDAASGINLLLEVTMRHTVDAVTTRLGAAIQYGVA